MVDPAETGYKALARRHLGCPVHRLQECCIGTVIGERHEHIVHRDLEHHIHPALKVEPEVDLPLLAVVIAILSNPEEVVDRFGGHGVEVGVFGLLEGLLLLDGICNPHHGSLGILCRTVLYPRAKPGE